MVFDWFYNLKVISNALHRVLHRWVTEGCSPTLGVWVAGREEACSRVSECDPRAVGCLFACVSRVYVRPRRGPAPSECAAPHCWVNWGDLNPGPLESKNKSLSLLLKQESVTLHFLSHKICKNNAIIFILKIQL